jgi:hypothetical protein
LVNAVMTRVKSIRTAVLMVALSIVAAFCIPAQAQTTPLEGSMSIGGLTAFHAPPDKPKNTHVGFVIDGAAALRMFKAMNARTRVGSANLPVRCSARWHPAARRQHAMSGFR